jgi:hypothetical protein
MTIYYRLDAHNPDGDSQERCRRRLWEVLEINPEGIEVVLRLRQQVMGLQSELRELQAQLSAYRAAQHIRIDQYRLSFDEMAWLDPPDDS